LILRALGIGCLSAQDEKVEALGVDLAFRPMLCSMVTAQHGADEKQQQVPQLSQPNLEIVAQLNLFEPGEIKGTIF
jgi:hypothetical protein